MEKYSSIGVDTIRKDAWEKVTGAAKYNGDSKTADTLYAEILASIHAHAKIIKIDLNKALASSGVQNIITGDYFHVQAGSLIEDRPPIAKEKVRYFGEPVAVVIANSKEEAIRASRLIEVEYEPLEVVNSINDALKADAPIIHEDLQYYSCPDTTVTPKANTNIVDHSKIRKGNMDSAWVQSDVVIESSFSMPQSDHLAMETHNARAQISPNSNVIINTSSQAPFAVKEELSKKFQIPEGKIIVQTPLVGGAFGGKATVNLEYLAYLASHSVGGRIVEIRYSREQNIASAPSKIGIEAKLKIGATTDGQLKALECIYHIDCGAYADTGPRMGLGITADCTGPYNIKNVHCDTFTVYTNHNYVTSFRGFGHSALTFCMERILDQLSNKLGIDPLELRSINAIKENDTSPTQDKITLSNTGDLRKCISKLKEKMQWEDGPFKEEDKGMIRAKGISCFWKTSSSPTNASSGAIITVNSDGSVNLNCGAVEIGPGMKTTLAQILAEKLKMATDKVHVSMNVDTMLTPKYWKTVASMTTFMVGNAVLKAAEDLIGQLKGLGATVLKCPAEDLDVKDQRVYLMDDPSVFVEFKDLVHGYEYKEGPSIGGIMMGRGNYIMRHLVPLDGNNGKGKSGVSWTVGIQGVEILYDPKNYSYRILKAFTVIDVGKVINPKTAKGSIMGGMSMGISLATREESVYNQHGILENTSLRTYKSLRYGEQPEYLVDFVETPQNDAPFGARGLGEHGILGIPSAISNAIGLATDAEFNQLPIVPELIWKIKTGGKHDTF